MKKLFIFILITLLTVELNSQQLSNIRNRVVPGFQDTVCLDTLSIIPGSLYIKNKSHEILSDSLYIIDFQKSYIILSKRLSESVDTIYINYRVFPISFSKEYYHKDTSIIKLHSTQNLSDLFYKPEKSDNIYWSDGLNKSGSISRGISFGNQQDAVLNSNLNLQLSGKLNNELNISAAISDANIPIQPDGSSQQIQEFDKVFIKLYNEKTSLIAGDFEITSPTGYFLKLNKKAKGAIYRTKFDSKSAKYGFKTSISGALSKGKYCRKSIDIREGNQGPYKIQGCENESYIIILSGSEKIYIDGKLLTRGQENDYVINYNTAEVTFTPNQPITKDKRVIIEFEYSEQNYTRFIIFNSNEIYNEKNRFYINLFNEQDSKNQTLNIDLNDDQKLLLSKTGDDLDNAFYPNIYKDSIYNESYIYYQLKDTTVNYESGDSVYFDSVYEYSTNPDLAFYRLGFTFVGENNGNYIPTATNINGRIYEWIAPDKNGLKNGSHEPVILLIAPNKKQVLSIGGESQFGQFTTNYELAISNSDLNTFSSIDSDDNLGYALKIDVLKKAEQAQNSKLAIGVHYEYTDKNFNPVERFRNPEFERDWNISGNNSHNQQLASLSADYHFKNLLRTNYSISMVNKQNNYNAYRNTFNIDFSKSKNRIIYNASFLNTTTGINKTKFFRHKAEVSKEIKMFKVGVKNVIENNIWNDKQTDSLQINSFAFNQWEFYVMNPDSLKSNYYISYKTRQDLLPLLMQNELIKANKGEDLNFGFEILKNPKKTLKTSVTYRKLSIQDTSVSNEKTDNTLLGRVESNLRFLNNSIHSSTFYEIGTGLESVKEYSFVEVERGLGIYIWNDYNQNNIQEIEEFEIASYKDTANYLRVLLPGNYVKVYTTNFSQVFNIRPGKTWYKQTGIKKFLSRFSDQFAYRVNSKTKSEEVLKNINPVKINNTDEQLVSLGYSLKNTISFNRASSVFGLDYMVHKNARKDLLLTGYNLQENLINTIRIRWNLNRKISITENVELNNKQYESEAYATKNYNLNGLKNEFGVSYQPTLNLRISSTYKYSEKDNTGIEKSTENNLGAEIKYNLKTKGNLNFQFNYLNLSFNGETNSPLAYEMLEGFLPGNNLTWTLQYQQQLANSLQLNLLYNGRKLEDNEALHSGGVQLRAFF